MLTPVQIARSGTIASGQVGWPHVASGAIRSGDLGITAGTPNGTLFLRDDFSWQSTAGGGITSGQVTSGDIASGAVNGFFGPTRNIASGTVGVFDFGSGAVVAGTVGSGAIVSGNVASGQLGRFHIASGQLAGFELGSGSIVSGRIASGQIGTFALSSGIIQSGFWVASGSIFGQAGPNQFCIASGTVTTNDLGSGAIVSGLVASGQIGPVHLSSGSVGSGRTASGSVQGFFGTTRNISSGTVGSFDLASGAATAGTLGSGSVQGFFGSLPNIASGTVGVFDLGSGAVIAGSVGSGAIVSGNIASGQIGSNHIASGRLTGFELGSGAIISGRIASGQVGHGHLADNSVQSGNIASGQLYTYHLASGDTITAAQQTIPFTSGGNWTAITEERVSGVKAVCLSQSGNIRVAMASISGRMPAIGIVVDNVASGIQANVYSLGQFQLTSGMADYSGWLGTNLMVGRSGQIVSMSGSFNSGGLLSGDILQLIGTPINSGMPFISISAPSVSGQVVTILSGQIGSGAIQSGAVQGFFGTTPDIASGTIGVWDFGSGAVIAGAMGSGSVVSGNIASGSIGRFHIASGQFAGFELGSGSIVSGRIASGQIGTFALSSGIIQSGFWVASGSIFGQAGPNQFCIASGTITTNDIGSGAVVSGLVASGQLGRFHIASGQLAGFELGSGAIVSGRIASGQVGTFHLASGFLTSGFWVGSGSIWGQAGPNQFCIASGTITTNDLGSGAIVSGLIASGQVGNIAISSGAVTSGRIGVTAGVPNGTLFLRDDYTWSSPGAASVVSGSVTENTFASGAAPTYVEAFASGLSFINTITEERISGVKAVCLSQSGNLRIAMASISGRMPAIGVVLDNVASGIQANVYTQGAFQLTSGLADYSGWLGTPLFVGRSGQLVSMSGSFNSGGLLSGDATQIVGIPINSGAPLISLDGLSISGGPVLGSGTAGSGVIASGSVPGFFGPYRGIMSGTVGVFDLGSGAVIQGTIGSGAVVSGNIASGQVGPFHYASGSIGSGFWIASGSVFGQAGPNQFCIASGTVTTNDLGSGAIQSGTIASGQIGSFHIASGRLTGFELGSGAIVSGRVASGQIGFGHLANNSVQSGTMASGQHFTYHFASGATITNAQQTTPFLSGGNWTAITEERISGVRAVCLSQSGNIRVAMASISGRMPAIGVVVDNVASGIQANVYSLGQFQLTSGLADYSGWVGTPLLVGRSGSIVTMSGSFNSGGLLSGDVTQFIGVALSSGMPFILISAPSVSGVPILGSGAVGSGNVQSGAVQGFFGTTPNIASGTVGVWDFGSGAVIAGAMGSGSVVSGNVASGQLGRFHIASGQLAGFELGSGAIVSGRVASGQVGQFHLASGSILSGFWVGSGSIWGRAGVNQFCIASGTIATFDIASGGIVSGNIASGQIGTNHLSSGCIQQSDIASGVIVDGVAGLNSGYNPLTSGMTEEIISGCKAVCISQSGNIRVAMASISGRMPAIGVVIGNVASGIQTNVYQYGVFIVGSGLCEMSGYQSQLLYVGRSGSVVTASGGLNSGGLLSGDIVQPIGFALQQFSGLGQPQTMMISVAAMLPFVPGLITSGNIASGQIGNALLCSGALSSGNQASGSVVTYSQNVFDTSIITGETISGLAPMAVCILSGGGWGVAQAGSGFRMPAVGVAEMKSGAGQLSGQTITVRYLGNLLAATSGDVTWSGSNGKALYVGSGGKILLSGGMASGYWFQQVGTSYSGGLIIRIGTTAFSGLANPFI